MVQVVVRVFGLVVGFKGASLRSVLHMRFGVWGGVRVCGLAWGLLDKCSFTSAVLPRDSRQTSPELNSTFSSLAPKTQNTNTDTCWRDLHIFETSWRDLHQDLAGF